MKIKNMRKERGLLQKYVASQLGISSRHYQRIENDEYKPSKEQLKILTKLFMCKMSQLLD